MEQSSGKFPYHCPNIFYKHCMTQIVFSINDNSITQCFNQHLYKKDLRHMEFFLTEGYQATVYSSTIQALLVLPNYIKMDFL